MDISNIWPEWEVAGIIGKGSFGTVYKIVREGKYEAALKVINIPISQDDIRNKYAEGMDRSSIVKEYLTQVEYIRNEIEMMESLKSAVHIVSIEDYKIAARTDETFGWQIYIRMELLQSMGDYLKTRNSMPQTEIVKLGLDICDALRACQSLNIIHRDVKPANILRTNFGDYKLGDFGISRQIDTTYAFTKVGTPSFEAPEMLRGEKYDRTVDIYGLGMVLYIYLNRGRKPFCPLPPAVPSSLDINLAENRRRSGETLPDPADATPALSAIIKKACSFKPADRYQSAEEFYNALFQYSLSQRGLVNAEIPVIKQNTEKDTEIIPSAKQSGNNRIHSSKKKNMRPVIITVIGIILCALLIVFSFTKWKRSSGDSSEMPESIAEAAPTDIPATVLPSEGPLTEDAGEEALIAEAAPTDIPATLSPYEESLTEDAGEEVLIAEAAPTDIPATLSPYEESLTEDAGEEVLIAGTALTDTPAPAVSPEKMTEKTGTLMSDPHMGPYSNSDDYQVFGSSYNRKNILAIYFLDSMDEAPEDSLDVSEDHDGSVLAWFVPADTANGLYEMYIAGKNGVMAPQNSEGLFSGYEALKRIEFNDAYFTENVTSMKGMFSHDENLTSLDLSSFNTGNVTTMSSMFEGCTALTSLNVSGFDTGKVLEMKYMFASCENLPVLDLSSFNTGNVTDMSGMFFMCAALKSLDLHSFDTGHVTDMSFMFHRCQSIPILDVSGFDTRNVKDMSCMFFGCGTLTYLDLEDFVITDATKISYMFEGCNADYVFTITDERY